MPSHLIAQVAFQNDSLLVEDQFVNTFSFFTNLSAPSAADLDALVILLTEVYKTAHLPGTVPLIGKMSSAIAPLLTRVRIYNRGDVKPRTPLRDVTVDPGTTSTTALPNEVALCLSFRGALVSGLDPKRRRGRVYMGPFATAEVGAGLGDSRPSVSLQQCVVGAGNYLANQTSFGGGWEVWSPTLGTGTPVVAGWCDDSWDTMRSRGRKPTSRLTFVDLTP